MKNKADIDQKVREALESLDGIQRAEPAPYFYTRLIARLQRDQPTIWETMGAFLARPAVAIASLFLILLLNGFLLFRQDETAASSTPMVNSTENIVTDNEYILASSSSFDYENLDQQ